VRLTASDNDSGSPDSLTVRVNTIGVVSVTLFLPDSKQSGDVPVTYAISDSKGNTVSLGVEYARSSLGPWSPAAVEGTTSGITPDGYSGSLLWKAAVDLDGYEGPGWLRVTPDNGAPGMAAVDSVLVDYNDPPEVDVDFVDKDIIYSGTMGISLLLNDAENDTLSVTMAYSLDNGVTFEKAALEGNTGIRAGVTQRIVWNLFDDVGFVYRKSVILRMTPFDRDTGGDYTAGPFTVSNIVGDYNFDGKIDGGDLSRFVDAWNRKELAKEIGPVTGEPPGLTVEPDGVIDFEDLAVFAWMWNWYDSQAGIFDSAGSGKPAADAEVESPASEIPVRIEADGDGGLAVSCAGAPDYLRLLVSSADGGALDVSFLEREYWESGAGVLLTRSYAGTVFEAAGARFDSPQPSAGPLPLGALRFGKPVQGNLAIRFEVRLAGESLVRKGVLDVDTGGLFTIPEAFSLSQNSPNPFNPSTTIRYSLPRSSKVFLAVYTIHGQLVEVLRDGVVEAGNHAVVWDASSRANGVYIYTVRAGDFVESRKMVLMK
ncbi:MAG: T9SS type A sorting domain-containing protein, partial [Candidatus Latescibacteria bacterium]|nr:T9SS type A sorting domain-containing protein [Candidatus Latescibacterota bacterium]